MSAQGLTSENPQCRKPVRGPGSEAWCATGEFVRKVVIPVAKEPGPVWSDLR